MGDARTSITCMFSGALLLLTDSLCVYLRPFSSSPLRDTSFTAEKRRADPRTFDRTYNPRKRRHLPILLLQTIETRRPVQNQPDSAKFLRISRIPTNQQDYRESARFIRTEQISESGRLSPTAFPSSSHISPRLPTARSSAAVASSVIKRHIGLSRVRVGITVGPRPHFTDCS